MRLFYLLFAVFFTATTAFSQSYPSTFTLVSNSPACNGQQFLLSAVYSVPPGGTNISFRWSGPNSFTSNAFATVQVPASATTAGVYSVTMSFSGPNSGTGTAVASTSVSLGTPKPDALVKDGGFFVPGGRTICGPTSLSFAAYPDPLRSNTPASYRWTGPNSFSSTEQNPVVPQGVAGLYIVEATYPTGCGVGRDTITITNRNPTVNVETYTTTGNPTLSTSFCPNSAAEFRAVLNAVNGTTATYQWRGPNGFTSAAQSFTLSNLTPAMAGTYSVTATLSGECTGTVSASGTIAVGPPTVFITSRLLAPTQEFSNVFCTGSSFRLAASNSQSLSATYQWSGPNGFTSNAQSNTFTNASPALSGLYSVTATFTGACSGTATTSIDIQVGEIQAFISGNPTVCSGGRTTMSVTTSINFNTFNDAGATYRWSGPNGFTGITRSVSLSNVTLTATGQYSVTVITSALCSRTLTAATELNIRRPSIAVDFQAADGTSFGDNNFCPGTTFNVSSRFVGTSEGFPSQSTISYSWSGPNNFTSTQPRVSIPSATSTTAGTYNVTATVTGECSGTYIGASDVTIGKPTVRVAAYTPNGPSSINYSSFCPGSTVVGTVNSSPGNASAISYRWSGPNNFTSTDQTISVANLGPANTGLYTVTVTYGGLCSGQTVGVVYLQTSPPVEAIALLRANGSGSTLAYPLCPGNTYRLRAFSTGSNTYVWTLPNSTTISSYELPLPNVTSAVAGTYRLTTTYGGVCSATSSASINITVGIPAPHIRAERTLLSNGQSTQLAASARFNSTILWSDGQAGQTVSVTPVQTTTYTAVVISDGCTSARSEPVTVRATSQPPVTQSLRMQLSNRTPALNQPVSVTLVVENTSANTAGNVRVRCRLPQGLALVSAGDMQVNGTDLTGLLPTVAGGNFGSLVFAVKPTANGTYRIAAQLTQADNPDTDSEYDSGTNTGEKDVAWADFRTLTSDEQVLVSPEPNPAELPEPDRPFDFLPYGRVDLSLAMVSSKLTLPLNETAAITLRIDKVGSTEITVPQLTCVLPTGLTFIDGPGWTATGQTLAFSGGTYFQGLTQTTTFRVRATDAITQPIKARISYSDWADVDSDPSNDFDTGEDDTAELKLRVN